MIEGGARGASREGSIRARKRCSFVLVFWRPRQPCLVRFGALLGRARAGKARVRWKGEGWRSVESSSVCWEGEDGCRWSAHPLSCVNPSLTVGGGVDALSFVAPPLLFSSSLSSNMLSVLVRSGSVAVVVGSGGPLACDEDPAPRSTAEAALCSGPHSARRLRRKQAVTNRPAPPPPLVSRPRPC